MKKIICCLLALMLCMTSAAFASTYDPMELTVEQSAAMNLFLSNFTEVAVEKIEDRSGDMMLVDFAHDHLWMNDYESFEYGDYDGDLNCRVSDDRIQEIINKYFYDPTKVDLTQTRFDYEDGYYYHTETGGWLNAGFAHTLSLCSIGEDKYFVSFYVFGGGDSWENDVMDDTLDEIEAAFHHPTGYGSALIYATDLSDRSTYRMISFSRV